MTATRRKTKTITRTITFPAWALPAWVAFKAAFKRHIEVVRVGYDTAVNRRAACTVSQVEFYVGRETQSYKINIKDIIKESTAEELLKDIQALVERRQQIYGDPKTTFERQAKIQEAIEDCPDKVMRMILQAIAMKMVRIVVTPHHIDSWRDIIGYAICALTLLTQRGI